MVGVDSAEEFGGLRLLVLPDLVAQVAVQPAANRGRFTVALDLARLWGGQSRVGLAPNVVWPHGAVVALLTRVETTTQRVENLNTCAASGHWSRKLLS